MKNPPAITCPDPCVAPANAPRTRWMPVASHHLHPTATAAYFKAQARGFRPGAEMHDWLVVIDQLSHNQPMYE